MFCSTSNIFSRFGVRIELGCLLSLRDLKWAIFSGGERRGRQRHKGCHHSDPCSRVPYSLAVPEVAGGVGGIDRLDKVDAAQEKMLDELRLALAGKQTSRALAERPVQVWRRKFPVPSQRLVPSGKRIGRACACVCVCVRVHVRVSSFFVSRAHKQPALASRLFRWPHFYRTSCICIV